MNTPSGRLIREDSLLVVVDVQEKLLPAIHNAAGILHNVIRMVQVAQELQVPILVTEQYPRGLGATVAELKNFLNDVPVYEKNTFSCFGGADFLKALQSLKRRQLVLTGIETHICVGQTALEALERGYSVHVIHDAAGSRTETDKQLALARIRDAGGVVSGVEMAVYEWLGAAGSAAFKAILPLIK
ncbi:MAG TPA: hydrolase [Patescibacteria group bacterium]|nr:hydrolase [Patescibacteria group bacterium]